jgi:hypothetical protein
MLDRLVFEDETGKCFGDLEPLKRYAAAHPQDRDVGDWLSEKKPNTSQ